jgi:hypothetical protein
MKGCGDWFLDKFVPWVLGGLIVLVFVGLIWSACTGDGIPACGVCHRKMYRWEVDYYITTFQQVGDVQVLQQTPVYKAMPHSCKP